MKKIYKAGIDIGSTTAKMVVMPLFTTNGSVITRTLLYGISFSLPRASAPKWMAVFISNVFIETAPSRHAGSRVSFVCLCPGKVTISGKQVRKSIF